LASGWRRSSGFAASRWHLDKHSHALAVRTAIDIGAGLVDGVIDRRLLRRNATMSARLTPPRKTRLPPPGQGQACRAAVVTLNNLYATVGGFFLPVSSSTSECTQLDATWSGVTPRRPNCAGVDAQVDRCTAGKGFLAVEGDFKALPSSSVISSQSFLVDTPSASCRAASSARTRACPGRPAGGHRTGFYARRREIEAGLVMVPTARACLLGCAASPSAMAVLPAIEV
jgi:hypothetical protein